MNTPRQYTFLDRICLEFDQAVRALSDTMKSTGKTNPAMHCEEHPLSDAERKMSAALMRVNHAGEICAQALYHGQAVISRDKTTQHKMHQAALEEGDHLRWCHERIVELGSHTSYLNPLWYAGSFCIGLTAGMVGDDWSLGFVAETERQVIKHLAGHKHRLPAHDERSLAILTQMEKDEAKHRDDAIESGARPLPRFIKILMGFTSKLMVKSSQWL